MTYQYDVLIIGSGAAGLSLALQLADHASIGILSKNEITEGATTYAQGGIAAVLDANDSIKSHIQDTLYAGAGLCQEKIVQFVVEHGRQSIQWLDQLGVNFTKLHSDGKDIDFHLHQEGGHSHRRILHASDSTGRAMVTTLGAQVSAHKNIEIFEHRTAIDLIMSKPADATAVKQCYGAYVYNQTNATVEVFKTRFLILATGGAGKTYLYTSNPDTCTGDGVAMAWRAGCRIANMEFMQFHPTCLFHRDAKSFLISEALRGEGAKLILKDGSLFMHRFHAAAELAPRDIVARAIDHEIKRLGVQCVYLDITHKTKDFITSRFPTIYKKCLHFGFDIVAEPIPVVPAAHYSCGGVMVNIHGQTDVCNLYAIGEVAHSGLHGANRIASNSLLECIVFANSAAKSIKKRLSEIAMPQHLQSWDESQITDSKQNIVIAHNWDEIRRCMWDYVGVVRTTKNLRKAKQRLNLLKKEINEYYRSFRISNDLIELRNLVTTAQLIVACALKRKESRGLHYSLDYPKTNLNKPPQNTILIPKK